MQLFVTGTDTEIGKTYFSAWLVRHWRKQGFHAAALKPISSGGTEDAQALRAAADNELTIEEINIMRFRTPAAPHVSAQVDNIQFNWKAIAESIDAARHRFSHLIVEGIGGWLVPLEGKKSVREWAMEIKLPVVVVARAGLGTINHTLLTVESIERAGLPVAGIVLNEGLPGTLKKGEPYPLARSTNADTLVALTHKPVFVFDLNAESVGAVPAWLGGKQA